MSEEARERQKIERWFPLAFLACAFLAVSPCFDMPHAFAAQYDWRYFVSWIEVGRRSVLWFHQFPLWNPYGCGGEVLLANPQSEVAAPTFILPLIFGTALGVKLVLAFYFFCAFDGMYRLARDYRLSIASSWFASVLFGAGGWLALHLSSGQSNFASAGLFPYLILFYRRGNEDWIWTLPLGLTAAWIVCLGGTSTPAMATVMLATVAIVDAIKRRSARPFATLAAGALAAALLGAFRLLPALEFALDHPRRQWETDSSTLFQMIRNGFWWKGLEPVPGKRYWFHEYGWRLAYVTPPFIGLSLWSKKMRSWWIVVIVGAGIVAGSAIPYGPWWLLKHLPIYRDLRVPSRYAILFAIAFPLLCAGALDVLRDLLAEHGWKKLARFGPWVIVVLALGDGLAFDVARFRHVFEMISEPAKQGTPFWQVQGEWRVMMSHVLAGHGAIGCDEEAPLERAEKLDEGPQPQVKLAEPDAGTVGDIRWTPNRVSARVHLSRPSQVLFNENWNEHWKSTAGRVVRFGPKHPRDRDGGRLAVDAPAGDYELAVFYRPTSFLVGATISLIALPLALLLFILRRKRSRPSYAASSP